MAEVWPVAGDGLRRARGGGAPVSRCPGEGERAIAADVREGGRRACGVGRDSVGDIDGDLTTFLTACTGPNPCEGAVWHVEFDWIIDAGAESFTAHLSGVLNNVTGSVVMDGTVVDGFLEGAQVHEQGHLVNAETLRFEGTIRVMPATD